MNIVFRTNIANAADRAVYTFSSLSVGAPSATRKVLVVFASRNLGDDPGPPAILIGGVSATILAFVGGNPDDSNASSCGIAVAEVPDGATTYVRLTYGSTMLRASVGVYTTTDDVPSPDHVDTDILGDVGTLSVGTVSGQRFLVCVNGYTGDNGSSGFTADFQNDIEAIRHVGGTGISAGQDLTYTWSTETSTVVCMCVVSWGDTGSGNPTANLNNTLRSMRQAL